MRLKRDVLYFVVAISALVAGFGFYVLGRSPEYVYFLPHGLGFGASLHSVLAPLGNSLPTFVHTFAFILLTAAVILPRTRRAAFALSGVWLITEALLELAQLPLIANRIAGVVPAWFAKVPVLDNTAAYFLRGTFDPLDLLSIVLGALAAYATILIGLKREQRQESALVPTAQRHRLWLVPVAIAALATTVASGGGGGGSVGIGALDTNSHLYVAGNASNAILSFNNANAVSASSSPTFTITGGLTGLSSPSGIAVDMGRNLIYVANTGDNSVLVFFNARSATGNVAPIKRIISGSILLSGPSALYLDEANDRLYVANTTNNTIAVVDNASATGTTSPSRVLSSAALSSPDGLALDMTRGKLYVANGVAAGAILTFNVDLVTGNINSTPVNTITGGTTTLNKPRGLFVDAQTDRLYIANSGASPVSVVIYNDASKSATTGDIAPSLILTGSGTLVDPRDVFVDTNVGIDKLYVSDTTSNKIFVFRNASTISADTLPSLTLILPTPTSPLGIFIDVTPIVLGSTPGLDSYITYDGSTATAFPAGSGPKTGDVDTSFPSAIGARQFYSYDITNIPANVTVMSALLHVFQATGAGTPYGSLNLGNVVVDHVNFGTSFPTSTTDALTAYNGTLNSIAGDLSIDTSQGYKSLSVVDSVVNDLQFKSTRGSTSQYRLRFSLRDSNNNDTPDYTQFTDIEDSCNICPLNRPPQLVITIVP